MGTARITKATTEQRIRGLIAGTQKHPPTGSLMLGGATYTTATIVQVLQSLADALATVDSAKAGWKDALKNATDVKAKVNPVVQAYRSWIVVTYGNAPSTLADYDVTPRKAPTPLSAEQKVAKAARAKATRVVRNTMGKVQKKGVKGAVLVTAPVPPSPAPQPIAPSPAASAPPQGTKGSPPRSPRPRASS